MTETIQKHMKFNLKDLLNVYTVGGDPNDNTVPVDGYKWGLQADRKYNISDYQNKQGGPFGSPVTQSVKLKLDETSVESDVLQLRETTNPEFLDIVENENFKIAVKDGYLCIATETDYDFFNETFATREELDARLETIEDVEFNTTFFVVFDIGDFETDMNNVSVVNMGTNPYTSVTVNKNDDNGITYILTKPIQEGPVKLSELLASAEIVAMKTRDETAEARYTFKGFQFDKMDGAGPVDISEIDDDFWWSIGTVNLLWDVEQKETKTTITIIVNKNDGTGTREILEFEDSSATADDDVDYVKILDKLSSSMKTRTPSAQWTYSLRGLAETHNGEVINVTSRKFKSDTLLYLIWETRQNYSTSNPDMQIKAGKITILNNIMFVIPKDNDNFVKSIVYCNKHYYILCGNLMVYKLNERLSVVNILDLTGYTSDINSVKLFASEKTLIMVAGNNILTDKESVQNGGSVNETRLEIDNRQFNTKMIAKINIK